MELAFGIILLVAALFLVVAVLMQHGKSYGLSGTISGASETFFGKSKAQTLDKILSRVTTVVAIVFCILILVMYMLQGKTEASSSTTTPIGEDSTTQTDATEPSEEATEPSEQATEPSEEPSDAE